MTAVPCGLRQTPREMEARGGRLDWRYLVEELDRWDAGGRAATLRRRDDDAVDATPQLTRLLHLAFCIANAARGDPVTGATQEVRDASRRRAAGRGAAAWLAARELRAARQAQRISRRPRFG